MAKKKKEPTKVDALNSKDLENINKLNFRELILTSMIKIGTRMTAYTLGIPNPTVLNTLEQKDDINGLLTIRLRAGLQAALILEDYCSPKNIAIWFFVKNNHLENESPASILKNSHSEIICDTVVEAAIYYCFEQDEEITDDEINIVESEEFEYDDERTMI